MSSTGEHIHPKRLIQRENSTAIMKCKSQLPPTWSYKIDDPYNLLKKSINFTSHYLTILSLQKWHAGQYWCEGKDHLTLRDFKEWIWIDVYNNAGQWIKRPIC